MKPPCLNCEDRSPICHSQCDKYLTFKKEHNKIKKEKDKIKQQIADYYSMKEQKFKRMRRR